MAMKSKKVLAYSLGEDEGKKHLERIIQIRAQKLSVWKTEIGTRRGISQ
jgi:hypothetical protein